MKKFIKWTFFAAILHFFVSFSFFLSSFSAGMGRFGSDEELGLWAKCLKVAVDILLFPVVIYAEYFSFSSSGTLVQYLPFVINSMLWGIVIVVTINFFRADAKQLDTTDG